MGEFEGCALSYLFHLAWRNGAEDSPAAAADVCAGLVGGRDESGAQHHHVNMDPLSPGRGRQSSYFPGVWYYMGKNPKAKHVCSACQTESILFFSQFETEKEDDSPEVQKTRKQAHICH